MSEKGFAQPLRKCLIYHGWRGRIWLAEKVNIIGRLVHRKMSTKNRTAIYMRVSTAEQKPDLQLDDLRAYEGPIGVGLVPLSAEMMYMYVTTPEPGNPRYEHDSLAKVMREKLAGAPPGIAEYVNNITDNDGVVYKPLEAHLLEGDWFAGNVIIIGDAAHGTTPHLGQGAGMAIEDAMVLAEELANHTDLQPAFQAYRQRRFERCRYIVEKSREIGESQLGLRPPADQAAATAEMFKVVSAPI